MSKNNAFNSQELKNEINMLVEAGEAIDHGKDISGSMVKLNKTMNNIQPLLDRQGNYIKNFFSQETAGSGDKKQSEMRRYMGRICEITINDIGDMIDAGEEYFTIDFKNSWIKIKNTFEKELNEEKDNYDPKKIIDLLFRIINVKDYMMASFFKSFMFRKCVLWKDLNIVEHGYVHSEKKAMSKYVDELRLDKGYIPTKPIFDWMGLDIKGRWTMNKLENSQINLIQVIKVANSQIEQIFDVLRNYANLTVEQRSHQDINRNKQSIKSLRQEIQDAKINYFQLQKKYRQAIVKDQKTDMVELRQKIESLQNQVEEKDSELKKIKFEFRDSAKDIKSLRDKVKELEGDINRISNEEMKKLKDLGINQQNLFQQFSRIHKKISNIGAIFQFESDGKKSLGKEINNQQIRIEQMATIIGRQKMKNRSMQEQMIRLNTIILELSEKLEMKNRDIENLRREVDSSN